MPETPYPLNSMRDPRIAIITDEPGWHGRQLKRAFTACNSRGVYVSSLDCRLEMYGDEARVRVPGFEALPAGVFVRGIPGGTLEQVILRLDVLHALRELGVVVYNDARAIERTVDKAMTSFLLRRAGIPTPDTWACESEPQARAIVMTETARARRLVAKPLFGSQGNGVRLVETPADLASQEGLNGVFYLQAFVEKAGEEWCDLRVFVINGHAVAGMYRRNPSHWVTNRAQGGRCQALSLDAPLCALAEAAVRAVGIDYAGVDLIPLRDGDYTVTEVNSIPAWQGLQSVCRVNIAARLADHFFARIAATTPLQALP
ncbi:MAG: ATP-grasp domain-containing protein [Chromatiales bacterium]